MTSKEVQEAAGAICTALDKSLIKDRHHQSSWTHIRKLILSSATAEQAAAIVVERREQLAAEKKQPADPVQTDEWPAPKETK